MRRTVVAVWAVGAMCACGPEVLVEQDVPSSSDGGVDAATADVPGLDAPGADVPSEDAGDVDDGGSADSGSADAGVPDAGVPDAGDFEGHIMRLANMDLMGRTVELCVYPDGIENPPIRLMEELGRPAGLEPLQVSARIFVTPLRASVPVRLVDASDDDCSDPIFSTAFTGVRNRVIFVFSQLAFSPEDDTPMGPTATDQWRHLHHEGASGVLAMTPDDGSAVFRPGYDYMPVTASGEITYTPFEGSVILDRGFTPQPGGFITSFTLAPTSDTVDFVLCDDVAPPVDGLTVCGDSVRP